MPTQSVANYIVPIFRDAGDVKKYALLGRWHSTCSVVGDGVNTITATHYFQNVAGMFGPHVLWDLRLIAFEQAGTYVATVYSQMMISANEPTAVTGPSLVTFLHPSYTFPWDGASSMWGARGLIQERFLFKCYPYDQIQFNHYPTAITALTYIQSWVGGYLYDERYLEHDGR